MQCEVCGSKIYGKPFNVIIEGAKLTVCSKCSKHGKAALEEKTEKRTQAKPPLPKPRLQQRKTQETRLAQFELVEDFHVRIRAAREKLGLSHEDFGRKLKEKASVLRKIEAGKMTPDDVLAKKLEHELKIRLLVPVCDESVFKEAVSKPETRELTLGDLIQQGKKNEDNGGATERGQS